MARSYKPSSGFLPIDEFMRQSSTGHHANVMLVPFVFKVLIMNIPALLYRLYEPFLWSQIKSGPKPHHIGLIVDGNRRFARIQGMASNEGHNAG